MFPDLELVLHVFRSASRSGEGVSQVSVQLVDSLKTHLKDRGRQPLDLVV